MILEVQQAWGFLGDHIGYWRDDLCPLGGFVALLIFGMISAKWDSHAE